MPAGRKRLYDKKRKYFLVIKLNAEERAEIKKQSALRRIKQSKLMRDAFFSTYCNKDEAEKKTEF